MQRRVFRKLSIRTAVLLGLLLGIPPTLAASGEKWFTDMKKAMSLAQASDPKNPQEKSKDLLIHFTGSDWCIWCKRLDDEIFSKEAFQKYAHKNFILVSLDFPRKKQLPEALKKQNEEWLQKLHVTGFPTVFLTDAKGRPYAKTGYRRGGAEEYVKHLQELVKLHRERDKFLDQAEKAEGTEKAKLLDKAIGKMESALITSSYKDIAQQIIKLDPENKAGLKNKYLGLFALQEIAQLKAKRDVDGALAKIEETIKKLKPEGRTAQDLLFVKSELLFFVKKDKPAAKKALEDALSAAPHSEKAVLIKGILARFFPEGKKAEKKVEKK